MSQQSDFDKEFKDWLEAAAHDIDGIKHSAVVLGLMADHTDAQQCLQIGAALLYEKPLVLLRLKGAWIPRKLIRLADAVIDVDDINHPQTRERIAKTLRNVLERENHI